MKKLLLALALFLLPISAQASTCFWVGGTQTYSTANTASWASASGGTTGTCAATGGVPKNAGDIATFDAASGGGTVTADTTLNGMSIASIVMGAFTGTLDFSVNNPSITLSGSTGFSGTGTGTRTLNMGSGTWTLTGVAGGSTWDLTTVTNFTFNANTSTIAISPSGLTSGARGFAGGGKSYSTVTVNAPPSFSGNSPFTFSGNNTFATLNINGPSWVRLSAGSTTTVTNAFNWAGTSSGPLMFDGGTGSSATVSSANNGTMTWAALTGLVFSGGGTFTATSSLNLGGNTGITITAPSGSGGRIIGG